MADLTNDSSATIRLTRFIFTGAGVGTTARVIRVDAIPFTGFATSTADGIYQTYPPAGHVPGHGCIRQRPLRFAGYMLKPHSTVRALVLVRIASVGRLESKSDVVYYRAGGTEFRESVPYGVTLRAARGVPPHPLGDPERRCLAVTTELPR